MRAPDGFPPSTFQAGAVGLVVNGVAYSPLIQLPDGTIENAPQIAFDANGDGRIDLATEAADKVVALDVAERTVTYRETHGFSRDRARQVRLDRLVESARSGAGGRDARAGARRRPPSRAATAPTPRGRASPRSSTARPAPQPPAPGPQLGRRSTASTRSTCSRGSRTRAATARSGTCTSRSGARQAVAAGANTRQTEFAAVEKLAEQGTVTGLGGARVRRLRVHRRLPDRQRGPITRLHSGAWMPTRSMRSSCRRSPRGSRTPRRPSWAGSSRARWSRRPTSARCSSGKALTAEAVALLESGVDPPLAGIADCAARARARRPRGDARPGGAARDRDCRPRRARGAPHRRRGARARPAARRSPLRARSGARRPRRRDRPLHRGRRRRRARQRVAAAAPAATGASQRRCARARGARARRALVGRAGGVAGDVPRRARRQARARRARERTRQGAGDRA